MGNWGRVNIGSGGGKLFAIIAVTYPAGSTCTCTNGTKTLTTKDTSGKVLFNVPSAGTWVVSCTNGTKTASKSVSITAEGQAESISFVKEYLFSESDGNLATWVVDSNATVTGSYIQLNDGQAINLHCKKVDLTNWTTLYIESQKISGGAWTQAYIAPQATTTMSSNTGLNFGTSATRTTEALDVSAYTGEYYIVIHAAYTTCKIYNIWLE